MASRPTEPSLVPLRLDSREQWLLHCVLDDRVASWRRYPGGAPPPVETRRALAKVQSGSLLFTPEELGRTRETIEAYRRRRRGPPEEKRVLDRIADLIGRALSDRGAIPPGR